MNEMNIVHLAINFKTLDHFKNFSFHTDEELAMCKDLEGKIIENIDNSPFYGIYFGDKLVARMSLYKIEEDDKVCYKLSKLEVLPNYRGKGYGKQLVSFAQSFNTYTETQSRLGTDDFWLKLGFVDKGEQKGKNKIFKWEPSNK